MTRGYNNRCVEGSKRSREEVKELEEILASNAADDYAIRMERSAERAYDAEIEW